MIQFKDGLRKKVEINGTASATTPNKLDSSQHSRVWCKRLLTVYTLSPFTARLLACSLWRTLTNVSVSHGRRRIIGMKHAWAHTCLILQTTAAAGTSGRIRICHRCCQSSHECSGLEAGAPQTGDCDHLAGYVMYTIVTATVTVHLRLHRKLTGRQCT